jgi:nitrite reductase/ring-hydroxylating ferredoxin subunit
MRPSASGVFVTNFRIRDRKYDVIYREIYIPHNKDVAMTAVSTDQAMTFLCKAADVPENGVLRVIVAGCVPLAVYNLDGAFYATEDLCSHGSAMLSGGFVEGGTIVCPLHFGSFDIRTGEPVDAPCSREIATFNVVERDGQILLAGD